MKETMHYRRLGRTGLMVSEVGFGAEWLERHDFDEAVELVRYAGAQGINLIDCWMPYPKTRDIIGEAIRGCRERWILQGHFGATCQDGQYVRTRELPLARAAFEDLLHRLGTDHLDLGMIHYVDSQEEWDHCRNNGFIDYVREQADRGVIRHIGLSTHNPRIAKQAVETGLVETILFSINPAFDMKPPSEDLDTMFGSYEEGLSGIDPERAALYRLCEQEGVGLTVMKGFFGGRLFDPAQSPFRTALTPIQCIHYALTRPGVASILCGYDTIEQVDAALAYETAGPDEKDYASVLASAPMHSCSGQCTYCGHCEPCPAELDIAMIHKLYDLAVAQETVPESVKAHYRALAHTASECIGCRSCEERCPFGVRITEKMERAAALFGC